MPNFVSLIAKKRDGLRLDDSEIESLIEGYTDGRIPDYQMAAFAMAVYIRGMSPAETAALTRSMLGSGARLEWPNNSRLVVDKHSTGGVGDKVSLVLAPLIACLDLWVPMISGRGLGSTGGTLDKLESIPGYRSDLDTNEIRACLERVGCVITGATADIAPADRKLYALRDVTATVSSIPLITASIMSKKLAEGLDALVLDVKTGSGAFMKSADQARALADSLVATGNQMEVPTVALITDMNQPLGKAIGNAIEVDEAVATLQGGGPDDLVEVTLALAVELALLSDASLTRAGLSDELRRRLDDGSAHERFAAMVAAQGGNVDAPRRRAAASTLTASRDGYVVAIDAERLGHAVVEMGGGRRALGDAVDHAVGIEMLVRLGHEITAEQPLLRFFCHRRDEARIMAFLDGAVTIGDEPPPRGALIMERVDGATDRGGNSI